MTTKGKVLGDRKQDWRDAHASSYHSCTVAVQQCGTKGVRWSALTSLAMSLEALALLMEIASALRS